MAGDLHNRRSPRPHASASTCCGVRRASSREDEPVAGDLHNRQSRRPHAYASTYRDIAFPAVTEPWL